MGVFSLRRSVLLSVFVHALVFFAWILLLKYRPAQVTPRQFMFVEVTPPSRMPPKIDTRKEVVQTERGDTAKVPKPDSFLGERNQQVDRQTVSKNKTTVIGRAKTTHKSASKEVAKASQGVKSLNKLGLPILPSEQEAKKTAEDQPDWATPGSPEDYVPGIKKSERTALNTKEFVFYGYYQRIREKLDRAWVPLLREKLIHMYYNGRQIASDMDHTTRVLVVMNAQGEIIHVKVVNQSGTKDLDDAAVKAFNLAGPFPNPPQGIVDADGKIEIPWNFILKA